MEAERRTYLFLFKVDMRYREVRILLRLEEILDKRKMDWGVKYGRKWERTEKVQRGGSSFSPHLQTKRN